MKFVGHVRSVALFGSTVTHDLAPPKTRTDVINMKMTCHFCRLPYRCYSRKFHESFLM